MAEKSDKNEAAGKSDKEGSNRNKNYVRTGVAVGIGSAAIVAALLYANRGRKTRREDE